MLKEMQFLVVIYKSRFKSMVSNQQDLQHVGVDEFFGALQSIGVYKYQISGELLKIKYKNVALYSAVKRHSTAVSMRMKR